MNRIRLSMRKHMTITFQNRLTAILIFVNMSLIFAQAQNPIMYADVPDPSIIRVDDTYYMSSTTMHMSPGVPIMKSKDLVNWELVNYVYDTLADVIALNLTNGKNAYGAGSWASSLRFHEGMFYLSTFSSTTGKTHIYKTDDIEEGPWEAFSFAPHYHDNTLFFDEDEKIYLVWGAGEIKIAELQKDFSGIKKETERTLIKNATAPIGEDIMLPAEGSQLFKVGNHYYLFTIAWPREGMRTVIIHKAETILGPYESRVGFQDEGVAQGGLIDTPEGKWYAYLFKDNGAVGRVPYILPVAWEEEWPVIGENGKVPTSLDLPISKGIISSGIVASDDFTRNEGERELPLAWQWNHNPQDDFWSLTERSGFLRLTNDRIDSSILQTRNTLTQRTFGPKSSASIKMDITHMKDGDYAGLGLLQENYASIGIKIEQNQAKFVMLKGNSDGFKEIESITTDAQEVYVKASCDFQNHTDKATFFYSLDGETWKALGDELQMRYTLPHFMGYRFAVFNFATKNAGGYVDFDYFKINNNN